MNDEHDCDLTLTLNAQFATKILRSIHFPWSFQYDFQPAYYPFDVFHQNEATQEDDEAGGIIGDDVLAEPLQRQFSSTHEHQRSASSTQDMHESRTDAEADGERRYSIDFYSVSLVVPEEPKISLGNPIRIDDLTVRVKARFKASIRVFGREYSTHKSTPWVTLCGRSAELRLCSKGATIMGTPVLNDIDLVAKVKIFKWHYDCHLGLTKLLNKHLAKRGPVELLDLSAFQKSLTPDAENLKVERVEFDKASEQLLVKIFIDSPTPTAASARQSQ